MAAAPPTGRRSLGLGTRVALRSRHAVRLARDVGRFASSDGLWWLVPVIVVVGLFGLVMTTTTTVLPVAVYTLF